MLTSFNLLAAINENAGAYAGVSDVPMMECTGLDAISAADECTLAVLEAANDYMAFSVGAQELLIETALTDPSRVETLSENVFDNIVKKVKNVIDKIIAAVKKIIDMLKAFFFKLTGKTDKWLSLMKPKITAAQGRRGNSDLTAEMHEWDEEYISSGISAGIEAALKQWDHSDGAAKYDALVNDAKATFTELSSKGKDYDNDATHDALDKDRDAANEEIEKLPAEIGSHFGFGSVNDLNELYKEIREKATGGEKTTVHYGTNTSKMLTVIEGSKKLYNSLNKTYNGYLKALNNFRSKVDKTSNIKFDNEKDAPAGAAAATREALQAAIDDVVRITTIYHSATDSIRKINLDCINQMTQEYMTVLTKFVNAKEPKKD